MTTERQRIRTERGPTPTVAVPTLALQTLVALARRAPNQTAEEADKLRWAEAFLYGEKRGEGR